MSQLAELKTVFPEGGNLKYEDLLKGIRKDTLTKVATYLIGKNLFSDEAVDNLPALENWFSDGNKVFADDMYNRIIAYEKQSGHKLTVVYNISCLKILQYGLELEEQGLLDQKSKEQSEIDLFLAMLALNQNEDYHHTKDIEKIKAGFSESIVPAALMLNYSFPNQDITNFHFEDYNGCQVIKYLFLFNFLEQSNEGKELIKRFCDFFNLKNWQDYLGAVFPLILAWTKREHGGALDMVLEKNNGYNDSYQFLKKLALGNYIKMEDHDYIKIREKPLIELDDVTFRIIHPLFVSDKIYKGMFFLLKQLNEEGAKLIGNFRSWYTTNFSEGYCFVELIKYSFHKPDILFFDDELKASGIVGPPDSYLRQGDDVFLFENKDILIGASIKGSYDFEALIAELKKKLLIEGTRGVGIGQIINNIRKLLTGENTFDDGFAGGQTNIYPIITLHDPMFDAPGLNYIMNAFFQEELDKLRKEGINVDRVKPLALVNIDAMIQVSPLLKSGKIIFKDMFEYYYNFLVVDKSKAKNYAELESLYKNAMPPFYYYMKNYLNEKMGENWRSEDLMRLLLEKNKIE
ncbi:hypothetical protein EZ428_19360 [Pedobacter frigiditerrae]|uniref:Uncharacterized protein n=1 Tax=Pedobacter frigiditerrae TaxID=2530452 RepID=A0A4R0MPP0_9SPHI|nr:hypothetical protein [Pedobacter frigiditerrae]TCC88788.1 hypothetical protein EZ428_19360 [Pedobacter frigiditerrae]